MRRVHETSSCSFACRILEAFLTLRPLLFAVVALLLVGRRILASVIELGVQFSFLRVETALFWLSFAVSFPSLCAWAPSFHSLSPAVQTALSSLWPLRCAQPLELGYHAG